MLYGQFGCPYSKDPNSRAAGTGGPKDGTFKNLKTGGTEKRFGGGNIQDELISRDTNAPGEKQHACMPISGGSVRLLWAPLALMNMAGQTSCATVCVGRATLSTPTELMLSHGTSFAL